MSTNCIRCVRNKRTGADLLCDTCRTNPYMPDPADLVVSLNDFLLVTPQSDDPWIVAMAKFGKQAADTILDQAEMLKDCRVVVGAMNESLIHKDERIKVVLAALEMAESMLSLIRHRGVRPALLDDPSKPDNNQILEAEVKCGQARAATDASRAGERRG